ncbi:hypothetical protein RYX36_008518 [Vicia faba]
MDLVKCRRYSLEAIMLVTLYKYLGMLLYLLVRSSMDIPLCYKISNLLPMN